MHHAAAGAAGTPEQKWTWTFQINGLDSSEKCNFKSVMDTITWTELESLLYCPLTTNCSRFDARRVGPRSNEFSPLYFSILEQGKTDEASKIPYGRDRLAKFSNPQQLPLEFVTMVLRVLDTTNSYRLVCFVKRTTEKQHVWTLSGPEL